MEILDVAANRRGSAKTALGSAQQFRRLLSRRRFIACIQVFDYVVFSAIALVWSRTLGQHVTGQLWLHLVVSLFAAAMLHCVFQAWRLYDFAILTRGTEAAIRALSGGLIGFAPFLGPLLLQPGLTDSNAETACALAGAGLLAIALSRPAFAILARALRQTGVVDRRIYIVADSRHAAASVRARLEATPGNRVVGTWSLAAAMGPMDTALEGCLTFLRNNPIDIVILKMPIARPEPLVEAARVLRSQPMPIMLAPSLDGADDIVFDTKATRSDDLGNLVLVKLSDQPLSGWGWVLKDLQDRSLALLLLAIVSPALLLIAIGIKLTSPGPVFFRQKRYGYAGDTFEIFKFRTMRVADSTQTATRLTMTTKDDPRVFPLGRILRRTSLDELPQLLNVLSGDMWIIGPRPHSPYATAGGKIYRQAVREYTARYRIKPGITGWAQVSGWRGPTETLEQLNKRVEHDLYYIENWSMLFDIRILFKTLFCAFNHENAF